MTRTLNTNGSLRQDWSSTTARRDYGVKQTTLQWPTSGLFKGALKWAFAFFNGTRVLSYLPTIWTLWHSGDSSQHSLWTWGAWLGANITMSLWLIDKNGACIDRAALVNLGNAAMCLVVIVLIASQRI